MYALRYDGFVQDHIIYHSLEEAKATYRTNVKNRFLYEYDCAVVELDSNNKVVRVVSFEELR